ncbi:hypothetical protein CR51_22825 [Caballeronia megalochromosomata]|nr:hypothetical protein CR51_22825 [Caballeronia megalochromosomata]
MPRSSRNASDDPTLNDAQLEYAFRCATVAMILVDPAGAESLLEIPDEELGRLFKICLARTIGRASVFNLDLPSIREQDEQPRGSNERATNRRGAARYTPVTEGKLLRPELFCDAMSITETRLAKDVASGRVFSVDVKADQYYPAFFLASELDRKQVARVVRRLDGLTGWAKWKFFTEPKAQLANVTPLQALMNGEIRQILQTADFFVARATKLAKGKELNSRNS